jgi:glycosyltransferase involved in cell wall biosynthesis
MKLVVQIPVLNEQDTIATVIDSIPAKINGVDEVIILVIDDGCTDKTVEIAKKHGVKHFVHHNRNQGLGRSFHDGVLEALELGADILVNTDGDNQYPQSKIPELIKPILKDKADIVVADRQTDTIEHFSKSKKLLQRLGSRVVNLAAETDLPDAVSGFRAYSRESLMQINTITRFSYCTETIIQAGNKKLAITSIPIITNQKTRESRLFKSTTEHVIKSAVTIIRSYAMYRPYMIFGSIALTLGLIGLVPFARFLVLSIQDGSTAGHIQSLLVGSLLLTASFLCMVLNIIADLIRINRILIEDQLETTKRIKYNK